MKKISLALACIAFTLTAMAAKPMVKKVKNKVKAKKVMYSRQCCTKSFIEPNSGGVISITACAGWFLSNDAAALTRACDKADAAADGFLAL